MFINATLRENFFEEFVQETFGSPFLYLFNRLLHSILHCSAVVHSGDVLGELVGGYLHLQMAYLSIIHHVLDSCCIHTLLSLP